MSLAPVRLMETPLASTYRQYLLAGDRKAARDSMEKAMALGVTAASLLADLIWPTMEYVQNLNRQDRINVGVLNVATRLNRSVAELVASRLVCKPSAGKKALVLCGEAEPEELGGQIVADLFAAEGWEVKFAGGGVPNDEVMLLIGEVRPDVTVLFGTLPSGVPHVRQLIDYVREMNVCPDMQFCCCGGIYKRAEGLAEEIGADLYAPDAATAVKLSTEWGHERATPDQRTVGRGRKAWKAAAPLAKAAPAKRATTAVGRISPTDKSGGNGRSLAA